MTTAAAQRVYVGKVKWFDPIKGHGFILCKDFPDNVFLHYSEMVTGKVPMVKTKFRDHPSRAVFEDQEVQFEVRMEDRGPRAVKVQVVGWRES